MKRNGFSLIELLLVIAIIGILVGLAGPGFMRFVTKNRIESQTKRLYADIMNARVRAMDRNMTHFVVFNYLGNTNQYAIIADTNGDNVTADPYTGDTQVLVRTTQGGADSGHFGFSNAVPQNQTMTAANLGNQVVINTRGMASGSAGTICIANVASTGVQPSCNCIVVNTTQIRMGKINLGDTCDAPHCK